MRLTRKMRNGVYTFVDNLLEGYEVVGLPITKLGQLEDIEDELGIDLITLFKVVNADKVYNRQYGYYDMCSIDVKEKTIFFDNEEVIEGKPLDTRKLKDYGKTWALDKKELE